jgi:hypothetical protein
VMGILTEAMRRFAGVRSGQGRARHFSSSSRTAPLTRQPTGREASGSIQSREKPVTGIGIHQEENRRSPERTLPMAGFAVIPRRPAPVVRR